MTGRTQDWRGARFRRLLGITVPRGMPAPVADDLAIAQFARMRDRLPSLFVVLAMVGVCAMLLTPHDASSIARYGLPILLTVGSGLRYVHWTRQRHRAIDAGESRREMKRLLWMGPLLVGIGGAWAVDNLIVATPEERPLTIVLIVLSALAAAHSLATYPLAAVLALATGLAPVSLAVAATGNHALVTIMVTAWTVAALTARLAIGELRDLSANLVLRARLNDLANTDSLTGLANRRAFDAALTTAIAGGGGSTALAMIDLDGFKPVNDRFGHAAGDSLLQQVGHRLRTAAPPGALAARLGGDEFALLMADTDQVTIEALADDLRAALTRPYIVEGSRVRVGASIGTAIGAARAVDPDALYALADAACYREKTSARRIRAA
ncbi:diguanylate cyclase domain-containing protein [Sphingomonas sp.]|uniref:diguanylate cyclase domain-containing protein n=1 Tax=Sphingomonas sp. TaxID=28214 RepID=UPI002DD66496|nr:diguanylate cyclase [Sphingomonas sp.]